MVPTEHLNLHILLHSLHVFERRDRNIKTQWEETKQQWKRRIIKAEMSWKLLYKSYICPPLLNQQSADYFSSLPFAMACNKILI